jgi:hypothetical protein
MNAARAYRRLKEVEEKKLSNRLQLLKLELAKSQKKIEKTKERTGKILQLQSSLAERHARREVKMREQAAALARAQELNNLNREAMNTIKQANVLNVYARKRAEANEVKSQKSVIASEMRDQRMATLMRARANKNKIAQQRVEARVVREERAAVKRREAESDANTRIMQEAEAGKNYETVVQRMEKEELALIKMLEQTQSEQRHAFEMLEKALTGKHPVQMKRIRKHLGDDEDDDDGEDED